MAAIPKGLNTTSSSSDRIFQQIEGTADYYPPLTYSSLLTYYDDFVIGADPASGQFFPLTTTSTTWGEQSILFAIGIIPPAANVTGNLLDRTASIASATDGAPGSLTGAGTNTGTGTQSNDIRSRLVAAANSIVGLSAAQNPGGFQGFLASDNDQKLVGSNYFLQPNTSTCALAARGIWRSQGLDDPRITGPYKIGSAMGNLVGVGQSNGAFHTGKDLANGSYAVQPGDVVIVAPSDNPNAQHAYTVTGVDGNHITSVDGGQKDAAGQQYIGSYNRTLTTNPDGTVTDSNGFSKDRQVVGVIDVSKLPFPGNQPAGSSAISGDATGGPSWQGTGSASAQAANQQQSQLAGSPLLSSNTGQAVTAAQKATILATQQAISNMSNCPPLAMMVNPASFGVKGDKIVNDGNWGRKGPIIEYWGDQQDKISASGKIAGFFAIDTQNAAGPGVTRWARNFSQAWQNFQSLFQLYRSNGALFLSDDTTQGQYQTLSMLGSIYIYYDTILYVGSFDSFNITESDTAPHTIEYSFEFTVRASYLLDRTDDAFNYGVPQITAGGAIPVQSSPPVSSVITTQPVAPPPGFSSVNPLTGQTLQQQVASQVQRSL